jgi:hypothetical protein
MHPAVTATLQRVAQREAAVNIPSVAKTVADRLLKLKPEAARTRVKRDPGIRTLLHSKNPLDKFQGVMDDVFGSGMVTTVDPKKAIREAKGKGGSDVYRTLFTATLPNMLTAEQFEDLAQAFERHSVGMRIRSLGVTSDGSLVLTVITD